MHIADIQPAGHVEFRRTGRLEIQVAERLVGNFAVRTFHGNGESPCIFFRPSEREAEAVVLVVRLIFIGDLRRKGRDTLRILYKAVLVCVGRGRILQINRDSAAVYGIIVARFTVEDCKTVLRKEQRFEFFRIISVLCKRNRRHRACRAVVCIQGCIRTCPVGIIKQIFGYNNIRTALRNACRIIAGNIAVSVENEDRPVFRIDESADELFIQFDENRNALGAAYGNDAQRTRNGRRNGRLRGFFIHHGHGAVFIESIGRIPVDIVIDSFAFFAR